MFVVSQMISDHITIMPVFLFAASYTMSQFGRPTLTVGSQIGSLVDGAVRVKNYFHNDEVNERSPERQCQWRAGNIMNSSKKVATDQI